MAKLLRALLALVLFQLLAAGLPAFGQGAILQGGATAPGHAPMYVGSGQQGTQTVVQDSGPAGGGGAGLGLSETLQVNRGAAATGTGPFGAHNCSYDAPITSASGYHYFCWDANLGTAGALIYGAGGTAVQQPLNFIVNGISYAIPFVLSGIIGPSPSVVNHFACWNNTVGTLLKDCQIGPSSTTSGDLACWNNTTGTLLKDCGVRGRTALTASTPFYVDSSVPADVPGCGLAPGASACKTIQYFADILANQYDCAGNAVTIQLAHGTYAPVTLSKPWTGCPNVILQGDLASQSSVIVDGGGGNYCVQVTNYVVLTVQGLTVQNCGLELASSEKYAQLYFQNITFNAPTAGGVGVYCSRNSYCEVVGFGNIINGTGAYFIEASHQGTFRAGTGNVPSQPFTLGANLTVTSFIYASSLADATFTLYGGSPFNLNGHTVTGRTWSIDSGAMIQTLITSSIFFPGSVSGLLQGAGVYNGPIHVGTAIFSGGGAGPSIAGDDFDGVVTEGAGSTGVVLTFGSAFDTAPICTVSYLGAVTTPAYAVSINTLGTTHAAGAATFAYKCHGG